ncbi:leucine-rich repeat receptor-like serine/threonine/tyrosine-protein kinase SOBIR1 [Amaranthus tricolor]|uniref:leucine-rich repeat receptor-like serine/threonine/tyrosine-protein kinase SOBIR1 n=1 Tax=Amaranthus tricolor TaxID=29722 RepID=UPI00258A9BB3|nr:leucine-rich repeat receptor-like serine/threonine/tyrosine-protein kinase SOBIR1 [Amaranthus tricolor]
MEFKLTGFHFFCLLFSFIFSITHAKLYLDDSDYKAFKIIQRDLGIDDHHPSFTSTPCNSPAVSCERRVVNYTNVLKITRIVYNSKQLDGFISPEIGRLSELKELSLINNYLVDQIPEQIVNCKKLEVLKLKNNRFSGYVPSELSDLVRLRVLDLSMNKLSGDLSFLRYFPNLESLSLANNLFTEKVPAALKSFRNLQFFDISGNDYIQGPFPDLKGVEYISSSQVSRKSLISRRFIQEQNTSRSNHSSPAARHRQSSGPAQAPSPLPPKHKKHHKNKLAVWLLGFLVGGAVGGIFGVIFSLLLKTCLAIISGSKKGSGLVIFSPLIKKAEDLAFLENEEGLANLQVIGEGGCGKVYKAELPGSNGKIIAIKKVSEPPKDAAELTKEDSKMLNKKLRQIRSEIQTVGKIRHRNLLALLAHVPKADCHLLVYEYMKNGSLQDLIVKLAQGNAELDWFSRYRIALGVASGLEYLHVSSNPRIIHRDLKPANILLDADMEARIADFGLAKEMSIEKTHISTSNVAGTVGYIAPEYYQTNKFTDKCDIYSFGVVLGSLVIGKLPGDNFFQTTHEFSQVKWMRNVITSEEPQQAIDPKLIGNGYESQMLQVLKIACFCTLDDPKQRPNSTDVRAMLFQISL